jgi:hypothetical protein
MLQSGMERDIEESYGRLDALLTKKQIVILPLERL